ncbi:hypothetical protein [Tunicatimonas pelagia]|uniref:hypothetical protein n=1 Tax=Tunicatimonas pelagia TaxID=931531 RepID=UPI002664F813|nr:hypothetical protein [Tunicatimonas pelagia]WKN43568.1 hypothetical protein P0M28_01115 [Tunicatimonas pelagia]
MEHDINTFSKLGEGINFYLNESFHYINEALIYEFASYLFSEELKKIDPSDKDKEIIESINLPESPVELLQVDLPEVMTEETLRAISDGWNKAQTLARVENYDFTLDHAIQSIEMLGHLNNFGFFIETVINRHLLYLKQTRLIDDFSYSRFSIAKVMERIIFIFKDDISTHNIHLNEIARLFSLRNKTVHYTPDNAMALKPRISEMIQIWNQTKKLLERLEGIEKFKEDKFSRLLNNQINGFMEKWTSKPTANKS